ncbi:aminopeptidase [Clostridium tetanomorphum]|uniref:Aminopeptidase n=1 Tax=Clostridium tetanomorphum TaxID=1553 RepID=A0A923J0T8_CLOTT|nr:aminopeptidase [Clostridium tetanomorphum]KAJ49273.1 aminopeptidase [Clostridium tetanomorphum DSM 665]KAJ53937.1 aminopeptidase [Clostridium tetanomorphum DSM 665]MBC2398079.1 aminopeptidase [Clostridium tetanomorphum]MBP1864646.1 aminopeptidase [Clostridium tetanomorphum]NRS84116.1 aminopeptidase [Clostridium tetanomorphum]
MNNNEVLKKYAHLAVKVGVNIQKNQTLVISSPIECADFTRLIAEIAYEEGAKDVVINWNDELFNKIRFSKAPKEVFEEMPQWQKEFYISYAKCDAAFLSISASDPELLKDIDPEIISTWQKTRGLALKEYSQRLMSNKNTWSIISIPTKAWAKKIFPNLEENEAIETLWNYIFKIVRVDNNDPVVAWEEHKKNLQKSLDFLNSNKFKFLHYKNTLGTDLKIELPEDHIWLGGADYTPEGIEFIANIPTEEVFTLPLRTGVNGNVVSSKPLNCNGNLVENFSLTFKDGKIIDFKAEKGYESLKNLINTDEGSHYLGEVALVPFNSPISNSNIIFFNTLYDENASCHLAIGKAYPVCLKNSKNFNEEELFTKGVNNSIVHEDFMVGTKDLQIIGITADGKELPVFIDGNWAF